MKKGVFWIAVLCIHMMFSLHGMAVSQGTKDRLHAWLLSVKRLYKKNKLADKYISPPSLILEKIIKKMGDAYVPLSANMIDAFSVPKDILPHKVVHWFRLLSSGQYALVRYDHDKIKLYDIRNGIKSVGDRIDTVKDVKMSAHNNYAVVLYTAGNRGQVYNVEDGMQPMSDVIENVYRIDISGNETHALIRYRDKKNAELYAITNKLRLVDTIVDDIVEYKFSANGRYMWFDFHKKNKNNDTYNWENLLYEIHHDTMKLISFDQAMSTELSQNGCYALVRYADTPAQIYDIQDDIKLVPLDLEQVNAFTYSENNHYFLLHMSNGERQLYNTQNDTYTLIHTFGPGDYHIFSSYDTYVLLNFDDNSRKIYYLSDQVSCVSNTVSDIDWAYFSPQEQYMWVAGLKNEDHLYALRNEVVSHIRTFKKGNDIGFDANDNYLWVQYCQDLFSQNCITELYDLNHGVNLVGHPIKSHGWSRVVFNEDSTDVYYMYNQALYQKRVNIYSLLHGVSADGLELIARLCNDPDMQLPIHQQAQTLYDFNAPIHIAIRTFITDIVDEFFAKINQKKTFQFQKDVDTYNALPMSVRSLLKCYVKNAQKE